MSIERSQQGQASSVVKTRYRPIQYSVIDVLACDLLVGRSRLCTNDRLLIEVMIG